MINILNNMGTEGSCIEITKRPLITNSQLASHLMIKKAKPFSLGIGIRRRGCLYIATFVQYSIESPRHSNQTRNINKRNLNGKWKRKAVTVCRWQDTYTGNPKKTPTHTKKYQNSLILLKYINKNLLGVLWWLSACQCRRHRFNPWSWKIRDPWSYMLWSN